MATITRTFTTVGDTSGLAGYIEFLFDEPIVLQGSYTSISNIKLSTNGGLTMAEEGAASTSIGHLSWVRPDGNSYVIEGTHNYNKIPIYSEVTTPVSMTIYPNSDISMISYGIAGIRIYDTNMYPTIYKADRQIRLHAGYEVTITFTVSDDTIFRSMPQMIAAEAVGPYSVLKWESGGVRSVHPIRYRFHYYSITYGSPSYNSDLTYLGYVDNIQAISAAPYLTATFLTPKECYGTTFMYLVEAYDTVTLQASGYTNVNQIELSMCTTEIYYNNNGVWVECIPYCYVDGEWVRCIWRCGTNWTGDYSYQAWGYKYVQDL